jgi:hypothetical protein
LSLKPFSSVSDLGWLANFRADYFPFIRLVFLNGIEESLTLFEHQQLMRAAMI